MGAAAALWFRRWWRPVAGRGWRRVDLEAVAVLEVSSVVIGSASVGMAVGEQERPTVVGGVGDELVEL